MMICELAVFLYISNNDLKYFDSFVVENIPKEILKIIGYKVVIGNIVRIQADNAIIFGYFCVEYVNFLSLFLTNKLNENYKKNTWIFSIVVIM